MNWANLITGNGYNESNPVGAGVAGNAAAIVTGLSGSGTTVTVTANNNFTVGQIVSFLGLTTTLGLLLNGTSARIATVSGTQFTFASTATGAGSGENGLVVSGDKFFTLGVSGPNLTASVTSLSVSGGVITITAANSFLPGAGVTFANLTTTLGLLMNGVQFTVLSSTGTAFKVASTLTGSAGSDTGYAFGNNVPQPYNVLFWSANGSGYVYQYVEATGVLYVLGSSSITSPPVALGPLTSGTYPSGIENDVIVFEAKFAKDR